MPLLHAFVVAKKDSFIRAVVNDRQASAFCHRSSKCSLGAAAALAQRDFSPEALALEGITEEMVDLLSAGADLVEGFCQFQEEAFADDFAFQFVETGAEVDVAQVLNPDTETYEAVGGSTRLFP